MWWDIKVVSSWYCLCSDGTFLREQICNEGAKGTVVVMLQVSTYVNQIKNFQWTQQEKSILLSELYTEQLHIWVYWIGQEK